MALLAFRDYPALLGTAFLACALELRHAVDADHMAAIDNVTRKLMQDGGRPVAVGLFFSLGHSTVVVLASAAIAGTATALQGCFDAFRQVGGVVGTSVSALFLFVIAIANLVVLRSVYRMFQNVRRGGDLEEDDPDRLRAQPGLLGEHLGTIGYFIVAVFVANWPASVALYRIKRFKLAEVLRR